MKWNMTFNPFGIRWRGHEKSRPRLGGFAEGESKSHMDSQGEKSGGYRQLRLRPAVHPYDIRPRSTEYELLRRGRTDFRSIRAILLSLYNNGSGKARADALPARRNRIFMFAALKFPTNKRIILMLWFQPSRIARRDTT